MLVHQQTPDRFVFLKSGWVLNVAIITQTKCMSIHYHLHSLEFMYVSAVRLKQSLRT